MTMATLPELDLESLRLLVWIDELGSIGAAAGRAGISQPSASTKLKEFEARWRLLLVHRSTHGSHLTTDGKAVAAWAASVLHESELMQRSMIALGSRHRSGLVVVASLTIAEYMLPRWLGELNVIHEEMGVVLRVVNSAAAIRLVRRAQADLGFIETTEIPTDLGSREVGTDMVEIAVVPTHPWALSSTPVPLQELQAAQYLLREPGSGTRTTFEVALGTTLNVSFEASSTATLIGAALAGLGPAVVSTTAVVGHIQSGRLVAVAHPLNLIRPFTAIWNPNRPLKDAAAKLLGIVNANIESRS